MNRKPLHRSRRSSSRSSHDKGFSGSASLFALGSLRDNERTVFEHHVRTGCKSCEQELLGLTEVVENLALAVAPVVPSFGIRERLLASLALKEEEPKTAARRQPVSITAKGILLQQQGLLISRSADMPWEHIAPGFLRKTLFVDHERNYSTHLLRVEPGMRYSSHRHADVEEILVLEGDLNIHGVVMGPGDYCRAEPDSIHQETFTESGCLLLQLTSQLDQIQR
jgi:anti-sigma factor ChrR (cupin superfamily)